MRRLLGLLALGLAGGCSESPSPLRDVIEGGGLREPSPGPEFVLTWGGSGSAPGAFRGPEVVDIGPDGLVHVFDTFNDRIQVFGPDGTFVRQWRLPGGARGLAVAGSGDVFVAFRGNIGRYTATGELVTEWPVGSPGDFPSLTAIAIAPDGSVVVADRGRSRVERYDGDGTLLRAWGARGSGEGQFDDPRALAVADDGTVVVNDADNARMQFFAPDGTFLRAWGVGARGHGYLYDPAGIALDPHGRLLVLDRSLAFGQTFTREGVFVDAWGEPGEGPGQFRFPTGVAVDGEGRIFVADRSNDRIQVFAYP